MTESTPFINEPQQDENDQTGEPAQDDVGQQPGPPTQVAAQLWGTGRRLDYLIMAIDFVYMMALYPGVLSVLHGQETTNSNFTIYLFLIFNAGDFLGKLLPQYLPVLVGNKYHEDDFVEEQTNDNKDGGEHVGQVKGTESDDINANNKQHATGNTDKNYRQTARLVVLVAEIAVFAPLICAAAAEPALRLDWLAYLLAGLQATVHGFLSVSAIKTIVERPKKLKEDKHLASNSQAVGGQLAFTMCFLGVGIGSLIAIGLRFSPLVK